MKTCCDRHADYPDDRGGCAMLNASAPQQLEFDLWVEERLSYLDMAHNNRLMETHRRALIYGKAELLTFPDPMSMDTIVRYRA